MSMSEFDTHMNSGNEDFNFSFDRKKPLPSDFTEEDLAFAEELNTLFSLEQEELPPYFVQTLLQAEDPRFRPVEHGFEKKTSARVFRRLKLRRQLFNVHHPAREVISQSVRGIVVNRGMLAFAAILVLVMVFTVAFTAPSFTMGMSLLLQGSRSGVFEVRQYPHEVHRPPATSFDNTPTWEPHQISLLAARAQLSFPMYWPQILPRNYSSPSIFLEDTGQQWADGPILDLVYNPVDPKFSSDIDSQIIVREFKPKEHVLQLVQEGAAYPLEIDQYGQPRAIYVDGQWELKDGQSVPAWAYHGRSELIYVQDGIVFWIAGNQHYGVGEKTLMTIAQSLQIFHISHQMHMFGYSRAVTLIDTVPQQFTSDVLVVFHDDNDDSPSFIAVSSYESIKTAQKILATDH